MRCLLLSSFICCFIFAGCNSAYKGLSDGALQTSANASTSEAATKGSLPVGQNDTLAASCLDKFKPQFSSTLYNTQVNVVGRHLSGLLLFKAMPDSSIRIVFSSEMGVKFFDFEFRQDGGFKVYQVMNQLNKKAIIKTLKSDFELLMMRGLIRGDVSTKNDGVHNWYGFAIGKETHYYIVNAGCDSLVRIENAMRRKPKVQVVMQNYQSGIPDTIGISHKNFAFEIGLKHIKR